MEEWYTINLVACAQRYIQDRKLLYILSYLCRNQYYKEQVWYGVEKVNYKLLALEVHGDKRGKLISLENNRSIPFEIQRVYWIYDTLPNETRGSHAHKELEQVIVAIDGACEFLLDDGRTQEVVLLNRPDLGLYIGKNMWREMRHFSYGCKLMVLASTYYTPEEYIRDYQEFLKEVAQ